MLLLEGGYLLDPRLRPRLVRVLQLELPEPQLLRRAAARVPVGAGPEGLAALHRRDLPAYRAFSARYPAADHADLVLDGSNPLGPPGARGLDPLSPGS